MSDGEYVFPPAQAAYLRALKDGSYRAGERSSRFPARTSLVDQMPPVYQQAMRSTCVANAVTALLEYYNDCKTRLSVQFLFEATRSVEREALERNLAAVEKGEPLHPMFEAAFHSQLMQLKMIADANGADSPAFKPFLRKFMDGARARFRAADGSLVRSSFVAVERYGVCRHALWPYSGAAATPLFNGDDQISFPPGTLDDAKKRRVLSGLYVMRTPNNVEEMRGVLSGANNRRPMPVCVTLDLFDGCDGETFSFPETRDGEDGSLVSVNARKGVHGMLLVGYEDDPQKPGGGEFVVRNSWGDGWGDHGYGRIPYAYVECFCTEAGTILQDMVDYVGDGYDGQRTIYDFRELRARARARNSRVGRGKWILLNLLAAAALVVATAAVVLLFR